MKRLIITLSGLMLLSGCTPQIEYVEVPPETVTVTETIIAPPVTETVTIVTPPVTEYVEVEVIREKIVTVNQTVEVYKPNRDYWDNVEELQAFLDTANIHLVLKANADGVVTLENLCAAYSRGLSEEAESIGKRLEIISLTRAEYYKWYGVQIDVGTRHAMCNAIMENGDNYYVEPQTKEIRWYSYTLCFGR